MDVKETLREAKQKVTATVGTTLDKHGDKIETGLDKAAGFVDEKTHGKYHDQISTATSKAKDALGFQPPAGPAGGPGSGTATGPGTPPAGTDPEASGPSGATGPTA